MSDGVAADPLVQVRQLIADERQAFARDVDGLLTELRVFSASLGDAIGDVSRDEAIRGMRAFVLEKFDHHLPLGRRSLSEVLLAQLTEENTALRQLLREAFEIINDDDSQLDRRDWTREARKVLQPDSEGT